MDPFSTLDGLDIGPITASTLDHLDIGPWVHLDIRPDIGPIFDIGPITASTLEHLDIEPVGLYIGPPQTSICQPHSCKKTYQSSTCDISKVVVLGKIFGRAC